MLPTTVVLTIEYAAVFRPGGEDQRDVAVAFRSIRALCASTGDPLGAFSLGGAMPAGLEPLCGLSVIEAWGAWSLGPRTVLRFTLLRPAPGGVVFEIDHTLPGQLVPGVPAVISGSWGGEARFVFRGGVLRVDLAPALASAPPLSLAPPGRQALVVLGAHRSGTSAMARVLSLAGAALPHDLMPGMEDNPTGFWEPAGIVALNDRILHTMSSRWDDVFAGLHPVSAGTPGEAMAEEAGSLLEASFGGAPLIVLKDPRISVLVPFWHAALLRAGYQPCYVIMLRDPREIANSLLRRDGFARSKSLLLWASYMVAIERDTREARRCFVQFDALIASEATELARIKEVAGGGFCAGPADGAEPFVDASRVHRACGDYGPFGWAKSLYDALSGDGGQGAAASVERWLTELDGVFGPMMREGRIERVSPAQGA